MSTDGSVPLQTLLLSSGFEPVFNTGLFIAILALIIMSAFFSSTETAYSCANKIKLRTIASSGSKRAKNVLNLAENNYDKFISSVLIGNNIVNLSATTLATIFFASLIADANTSALVSTAVMTVAVLIFGEIIPKTIFNKFSLSLSIVLAIPIKIVEKVFKAVSNNNITKFLVEEASLNEIFIAKVGESK